MNAVRVKEIKPTYIMETQYGQKEKRNFVVEESSTGKRLEVSHFLRKDDPELNVGDEVLMELQVQGKYINCGKIEKFTPPPEPEPEPPTNGVPQKVWKDKDLRISRLSIFRDIVKLYPFSKESEEKQSLATITQLVVNEIKQVEEEVYRNMENE